MNREKITEIVGQIDEKHIDEATAFAANAGRSAAPKARRFRWGMAAACLLLILVLGSATYAYAAEAKEYREAVVFFEDNGLSPEGLSRSEIKEVYRDITTRRFTYGKTMEVIRQTVPGWEIPQSEPSPEELAALWDGRTWADTQEENGISFRRDYRYAHHEGRPDTLEASLLECNRDGETVWTAEFPFYLDDFARYPEGILAWGWNDAPSAGTACAWIACVDERGEVQWQYPLLHGFRNEYIAAVLPDGEGAWAVISRGDLKYLCLSRYDPAGKELSFHQTEVGNYGIWNAARLGDGYIVQLGSFNEGDYAHLFRMDREGNVIEDYAYEGEDWVCHIVDMAEFGGQVYLSAYAVPVQHDEGGRHEIAHILDYIFDHGWEITEEELTPLVRENYTALLLLCDPEGGEPQTFYSVQGSLGGRLSVGGEDRLEWDVESVVSAFFSPATSAFSIGGTCQVFRYAFDASGSLMGLTDTGETVRYAR